MKKHILFFGLSIIIVCLIAATVPAKQAESSVDQDLQKIAKKISKNGWVYFKDNFKSDPRKFFTDYKKEFNLSNDDEMRLVDEGTDSIFKFYKFQRYYKGILVEGSGYTLKYKNENLELAIGKITDKIDFDMNNVVKPEIALKEAMKSTGATKFAWEDAKWESFIRKENKDSSATWFPKEKLVITKTTKGEFRPSYILDIVSTQPKFNHTLQYIDAQTGNLVKVKSLIFSSTSTGITNYNGVQTFTTYYVDGYWRLQDRTRGIFTTKMNNFPYDEDWNSSPYLGDDDDNYFDSENQRPAISALWAIEKAYDYFHTTFYRHGIDNNNKTINLTCAYPEFQCQFVPYNSTHDYIYFGYYKPTEVDSFPMVSLDIVGHEYMHGITYYLNPLEYVANESGALNESFSDFFGECVEYYAKNSCDWLCGAEIDTIQRSMISPTQYGHPDPEYYHGTYWYNETNVDTYVHTNSGVPNRMFYLLANGDAGLGITGIGISQTADIAYTCLAWYLDEDANFSEAREAFIDYTRYHYGQNSNQLRAVFKAWEAVGVDTDEILGIMNGPENLYTYEVGTWEAEVLGGSSNYTYEWRVNGEICSTQSYMWGTFIYEYDVYPSISLEVTDGTHSDYHLMYLNIYEEEILRVYLSGSSELNSGETGYWDATVFGGDPNDYTYAWYIDDVFYSSDASISNVFYDSEETIHSINLTVTSAEQEVDADLYYVTVYPNKKMMSPENNELRLNVYPNPASDKVTLQISEDGMSPNIAANEDMLIYIVDKSGRILFRAKTKNRSLEINTSNLQTGVYTITTLIKNKKSSLSLIVKH